MDPTATQEITITDQSISYVQWALYVFLAGIPFIGFILLLVWAFGSENNIHLRAWAKGMLLLYVVFIGLFLLVTIVFGAGVLTFLDF